MREGYRHVQERVAAAASRAGRSPDDVTIVGVSKTFGVEVLRAALAAGVKDLGENRAQELKEKALALGAGPRWHFVGHLQTNKARHVVGIARLIHSLDRIGLAEAIARRAREAGMVQDVLLEVNIAGEASKHGIEPARLGALADEVASLEGIAVRGLMTMGPPPSAPEDARPHYRDLARLSRELAAAHPRAGELSMGMSRDYEVAVEEGATLVRVGEAIFGPRRPRSS